MIDSIETQVKNKQISTITEINTLHRDLNLISSTGLYLNSYSKMHSKLNSHYTTLLHLNIIKSLDLKN